MSGIVALLIMEAFLLTCQHHNPFNPASPDYDPPKVTIDSVNTGGDTDSTASAAITLHVSTNRSEVDIRFGVDSAWSKWVDDFENDTVVISGLTTGRHIINLQGRYDNTSETYDTSFTIFKVDPPYFIHDSTSHLADSLMQVRAGENCTLTVRTGGTQPFTLYWYRATVSIDSTNTETLIITDFGKPDSGLYYCIAEGRWGKAVSDSVFLQYLPPVNHEPYLATKLDLAVVEGGSKTVSSATLQVKDNDNTPAQLVFTIINNVLHGQVRKSGTTLDAGGTFTQQDIDSGRIVYQHDKSNITRDSLSFTVSDGKGGTIAQAWLVIRVGAVDGPPIAIDQAVSTNEDTPLSITFFATDPEGVAISGWEISRQPKHGTLTGSGATRNYTPDQDFSGADTFMFRGNDGVNWSDTGIITVTILPVNDAPMWKRGATDLSVKEGKTASLDLLTVFDRDPESDQVTFSKKSGVGSVSGTAWSWTPGYTAAASSPANCVISATDNGSPAKSADITLNIVVNDSLCKLTVTISTGSGTVQVQPAGTLFDPGTEVQITATPAADYVFKNWTGDVPEANRRAVTMALTMAGNKTTAATFVKTVETVTLNIGESYVHGSLYTSGYYFLSTRTSPAKLLRLNADDLSDYQEITFSPGHDYADQITWVESKKKLYVAFGAYYRTAIAEVDPVTMSYNEDAIVDTVHGASPLFETNGGQSMTNDGEHLYVVTARADTSRILKYSLSTMSGIPVAVCNFPVENKFAHAVRYENGKLYVSNGNGLPWIARVNAVTLHIEEIHSYPGMAFTDDFAVYGNYLFLGMEADHSHEQSGRLLRVDKNDFNSFHYFDTGKKGGNGTGDGYTYSIQEFGDLIWTVFATNPGIVCRIDPVSLEYDNYSLSYNVPNEIASDGRRLLITYWGQNPGIVQAIAPEYFK